MAKDPADRYQTPAELVHELENWSDERPKPGPVARTSGRPLWISPPTQAPASGRPATHPQQEHTFAFEKIEVFSPSHKEAELSELCLLEPICKDDPTEERRPDTHDTVSLSHVEETADVTAAARAIEKLQWPAVSHRDSDATLQEMPDPEKHNASLGTALPPIDGVVSRLWRRWVELVETIVAGRGSSRVDDNNYRTIHGLLQQACREAIESCPLPERRAFYEECLSIAQPWLKLKTFIHTEASILEWLLERCRQIEVELNGGIPPWTFRQVLGFLLLALSPAGAALWYWYYGRLWLPAFFKAFNGELSAASLRSAWDVLQTHPAMMMGVTFPLVIVFSIALLSRPPRS
jgi:hypothetical protein